MVKGIVKEVLDCQNKLRTDPTSFVPYLESMLDNFDGKIYKTPGKIDLLTKEGAAVVKETIKFLKKVKPIQALSYSKALTKAAQDHAKDHESNGISGHTGTDGSSVSERIDRYCEWMGTVGENCAYTEPKNGGQDFVIQLLVDDGVKSRGHRKNIFNDQFNYVGIAVAGHPQFK